MASLIIEGVLEGVGADALLDVGADEALAYGEAGGESVVGEELEDIEEGVEDQFKTADEQSRDDWLIRQSKRRELQIEEGGWEHTEYDQWLQDQQYTDRVSNAVRVGRPDAFDKDITLHEEWEQQSWSENSRIRKIQFELDEADKELISQDIHGGTAEQKAEAEENYQIRKWDLQKAMNKAIDEDPKFSHMSDEEKQSYKVRTWRRYLSKRYNVQNEITKKWAEQTEYIDDGRGWHVNREQNKLNDRYYKEYLDYDNVSRSTLQDNTGLNMTDEENDAYFDAETKELNQQRLNYTERSVLRKGRNPTNIKKNDIGDFAKFNDMFPSRKDEEMMEMTNIEDNREEAQESDSLLDNKKKTDYGLRQRRVPGSNVEAKESDSLLASNEDEREGILQDVELDDAEEAAMRRFTSRNGLPSAPTDPAALRAWKIRTLFIIGGITAAAAVASGIGIGLYEKSVKVRNHINDPAMIQKKREKECKHHLDKAHEIDQIISNFSDHPNKDPVFINKLLAQKKKHLDAYKKCLETGIDTVVFPIPETSQTGKPYPGHEPPPPQDPHDPPTNPPPTQPLPGDPAVLDHCKKLKAKIGHLKAELKADDGSRSYTLGNQLKTLEEEYAFGCVKLLGPTGDSGTKPGTAPVDPIEDPTQQQPPPTPPPVDPTNPSPEQPPAIPQPPPPTPDNPTDKSKDHCKKLEVEIFNTKARLERAQGREKFPLSEKLKLLYEEYNRDCKKHPESTTESGPGPGPGPGPPSQPPSQLPSQPPPSSQTLPPSQPPPVSSVVPSTTGNSSYLQRVMRYTRPLDRNSIDQGNWRYKRKGKRFNQSGLIAMSIKRTKL